MNKLQFMTKLGATMSNPRWSWGAVNHDKRQVFLSAWLDKKVGKRYVVQEPHWSGPAREEHDSLFMFYDYGNYTPYIYLIRRAEPTGKRKIAKTITSFYYKVKLEQEQDGIWYATPVERINT